MPNQCDGVSLRPRTSLEAELTHEDALIKSEVEWVEWAVAD